MIGERICVKFKDVLLKGKVISEDIAANKYVVKIDQDEIRKHASPHFMTLPVEKLYQVPVISGKVEEGKWYRTNYGRDVLVTKVTKQTVHYEKNGGTWTTPTELTTEWTRID